MKWSFKPQIAVAFSLTVLLVSFQNCGSKSFSSKSTAASASVTPPDAIDEDGIEEVIEESYEDRIQKPFCGNANLVSCTKRGTGFPESPYGIDSIACLQTIQQGVDCHYKLIKDIDASVTASWRSGDGWQPITRFKGTLDGQGHQILNLKIRYSLGDYYSVGLFGTTSLGAIIKNLRLQNVDVYGLNDGKRGVAALIGWASGTRIDNIFVSGLIEGTDNVGGVVGRVDSIEMSNIHARTHVKAMVSVREIDLVAGGIVGGFGSRLQLSRCSFEGKLEAASNQYSTVVGGIVGELFSTEDGTTDSSKIENCYFAGELFAEAIEVSNLGGIAGRIHNTSIKNSYANAQLRSQSRTMRIGGLVSSLVSNSSIENSFFVGDMSASSQNGALIQRAENGTQAQNLYWLKNSTVPTNPIYVLETQAVRDLTELLQLSEFFNSGARPVSNWDFTIWNPSTNALPKLR